MARDAGNGEVRPFEGVGHLLMVLDLECGGHEAFGRVARLARAGVVAIAELADMLVRVTG